MIDDIIKGIVSENGSEWIGMLTSKLGFSSEQAEGFVPAAIGKITGLFGDGGLDLSSGLDVNNILSKLNPAEIGEQVGVDADKATEGLKGMVPGLLSSLEEKTGGADGLMSMLKGGGVGDAVGKLGKLGKLFS